MSFDAGDPVMSFDAGDPVMSADAGSIARCDFGKLSSCVVTNCKITPPPPFFVLCGRFVRKKRQSRAALVT
jgi:hypothetical protein